MISLTDVYAQPVACRNLDANTVCCHETSAGQEYTRSTRSWKFGDWASDFHVDNTFLAWWDEEMWLQPIRNFVYMYICSLSKNVKFLPQSTTFFCSLLRRMCILATTSHYAVVWRRTTSLVCVFSPDVRRMLGTSNWRTQRGTHHQLRDRESHNDALQPAANVLSIPRVATTLNHSIVPPQRSIDNTDRRSGMELSQQN